MTGLSASSAAGARKGSLLAQDALTVQRNASETRFKLYGIIAITLSMLALIWLLYSIFSVGTPAFRQTFLTMPIELPADKLDKSGTRDLAVMSKVTTVGYAAVIQAALERRSPKREFRPKG
jgi:phosphate transport system permease protein